MEGQKRDLNIIATVKQREIAQWVHHDTELYAVPKNTTNINDAFNTFSSTFIGMRHTNALDTHGERTLLPRRYISLLGKEMGKCFICTTPHTEQHLPRSVLHQLWSTSRKTKNRQWVHDEGSIRRSIAQ